MRASPLLLAALVALPASSAPALAHSGAALAATPTPAPPAFRLEKLTGRAYCLFGRGGNVGVLVTDAGVLVVDDQYKEIAQGIVDQIRTVTDRPIRYLINTHYHGDHTGGNPVFASLAEIVAHDNVRSRLLRFPEAIRRTFPARIEAAEREIAVLSDPADPWRVALDKELGVLRFFLEWAGSASPATIVGPGLTYEGQVTFHLGGQEVRVFHVGPGHTDGDSIVYLKSENVVHVGDLFFNGMVPFIDALGGGSQKGMIENLDAVLGRIPPDAKVIPGHGPVTDMPGLRRYREFLVDLRSEVEKAVKAGRTKAEAVRGIRMERYPDIKPAFQSLGNGVAVIYDELEGPR
jgi:glyoxylase-like metal-dependent hydrolase (beta-lactamase superfamily II)